MKDIFAIQSWVEFMGLLNSGPQSENWQLSGGDVED